jgi:hypothetical protein
MFDNTSELLSSTWQESWNISESYDWNLEGVAESHESGTLH